MTRSLSANASARAGVPASVSVHSELPLGARQTTTAVAPVVVLRSAGAEPRLRQDSTNRGRTSSALNCNFFSGKKHFLLNYRSLSWGKKKTSPTLDKVTLCRKSSSLNWYQDVFFSQWATDFFLNPSPLKGKSLSKNFSASGEVL